MKISSYVNTFKMISPTRINHEGIALILWLTLLLSINSRLIPANAERAQSSDQRSLLMSKIIHKTFDQREQEQSKLDLVTKEKKNFKEFESKLNSFKKPSINSPELLVRSQTDSNEVLRKGSMMLFDGLWRFKSASSEIIRKNLAIRDNIIKINSSSLTNSLEEDNHKGWNYTENNRFSESTGNLGLTVSTPYKVKSSLIIQTSILPNRQIFSSNEINIGADKEDNHVIGIAAQISGWLKQFGQRINDELKYIEKAITLNRSVSTRAIQVDRIDRMSKGNEAKSEVPSTGTVDRLVKRDTTSSCVQFNSLEMDRCESVELLVKNKLNNSFLGTMASIKDSCRHFEYLFSNCWPKQLREMQSILANRNASLLSTTDFNLPKNFPTSQRTNAIMCGLEPRLPNYMLDRITWMWLNLCIDKWFRESYVENLKCLSVWNQERAQRVCNVEYRSMQASFALSLMHNQTKESNPHHYFQSPESPKVKSSASSTVPTATTTISIINTANTGNVVGQRTADSFSREIEAKTICCMFDLFVRCVYKQSTKDCGLGGAQFVVDFLSRSGTDDMKYLCNGETGAPRKIRHYNSNQRTVIISNLPTNENSPFIERDYCSEPSMKAALQFVSANLLIEDTSDPKKTASHHVLRPLVHGFKTHQAGSNGGPTVGLSNDFIFLFVLLMFSSFFLGIQINPLLYE